MNLEELEEDINVAKSHGFPHHSIKVTHLECMISLIRRLESELANERQSSMTVAAVTVDPIVEMNVELLRKRSAVGIEKYGTTLADNKLPLRAWLNHALEETLDKANYLQAAMQTIDAAPQQHAQATLSDEQIDTIAKPYAGLGGIANYRAFSRAILAASQKSAAAPADSSANGDGEAAFLNFCNQHGYVPGECLKAAFVAGQRFAAAPAVQVQDEMTAFREWIFAEGQGDYFIKSAWAAWQARAALTKGQK